MLTLDNIRKYCNSKKGVTEDFPFDFKTLTIKVGSKMFALTNIEAEELKINLKCDPLLSLQLRSMYPQITPGYHMNKKHWNTVALFNDAPPVDIKKWVDDSYNLVINKLSRAERDSLENNLE